MRRRPAEPSAGSVLTARWLRRQGDGANLRQRARGVRGGLGRPALGGWVAGHAYSRPVMDG